MRSLDHLSGTIEMSFQIFLFIYSIRYLRVPEFGDSVSIPMVYSRILPRWTRSVLLQVLLIDLNHHSSYELMNLRSKTRLVFRYSPLNKNSTSGKLMVWLWKWHGIVKTSYIEVFCEYMWYSAIDYFTVYMTRSLKFVKCRQVSVTY